MCGGGGGAPQPTDPLEEARAQILIQQEQARIQAEQRNAELSRQSVQAETDRDQFITNRDAGFQGALQNSIGTIEDRGLNPDDFMSQLLRELENQQRTIPFLDPTPGQFFSGDTASIVLDRARGNQRRDLNSQLNEFAAPGFAQNLFPDTADDSILTSILNEQFEPATDQLLRAFQRGNLTQQGFDASTLSLNSQRDAANARLSDVGGGVLTDFRNQLRGIGDQGFAQAGAFELGGNFDPNTTRGLIDSSFADLSGRLGGSIRNALGGEQLFNIEDVITRGGTAQGAQNIGSGLLDAFSTREKERNKSRGLGSEGVF